MKMVRMSNDPASFDQMAAINAIRPGIQVTQIKRKPSIKLENYVKDFDTIAFDCHIAEIDLSDSNGDVLKFVYDIINHSDFVKRGGILVQLVSTQIPATETTPATVVYSYNQILQAVVSTQPLIPPSKPPKLELEDKEGEQEAEKENGKQGEVVPIEDNGNKDPKVLKALEEMPADADKNKDKVK